MFVLEILERVTGIRDNVARSSVSSALSPLLRGLKAQATYARRHKTVHRTVLFPPALSGSLPLTMFVLEILERVTGIEPALKAWEALILPLNYTRNDIPSLYSKLFKKQYENVILKQKTPS